MQHKRTRTISGRDILALLVTAAVFLLASTEIVIR